MIHADAARRAENWVAPASVPVAAAGCQRERRGVAVALVMPARHRQDAAVTQERTPATCGRLSRRRRSGALHVVIRVRVGGVVGRAPVRHRQRRAARTVRSSSGGTAGSLAAVLRPSLLRARAHLFRRTELAQRVGDACAERAVDVVLDGARGRLGHEPPDSETRGRMDPRHRGYGAAQHAARAHLAH